MEGSQVRDKTLVAAIMLGGHPLGSIAMKCLTLSDGALHALLNLVAIALERVRTDRAPFDPAPRIAGATWVRPKLVAQLAYAEWTADDKLRQPAFLGLRTDKDPSECTWSSRER